MRETSSKTRAALVGAAAFLFTSVPRTRWMRAAERTFWPFLLCESHLTRVCPPQARIAIAHVRAHGGRARQLR